MDVLLAGYGSDSEDSSSSSANGHKATTETRRCNERDQEPQTPKTQTESLSTLLGADGDFCSSSSDDEKNNPEQFMQKKKKQCYRKYDDSTKEIKSIKRNTFLATNCLPSPRTTSTNPEQLSSMSSWSVDYLSRSPIITSSIPNIYCSYNNIRQFKKFEKLTATLLNVDKMGWAAHLQNQQEFHNPHFFQSAIEYFGIDEPLGSQAGDRINTGK